MQKVKKNPEMTLREKALEIALSQLGVTEQPKGSNAGPKVEMYLKSVGLGKGYSWCMAFMFWCLEQACIELGRRNPAYRTGGVLKAWHMRKKTYGIYLNPQPGDIFIMDYGNGKGHTGMVVTAEEGINTVEGNSNDEGLREGFEVCMGWIGAKRGAKVIGYLRFD